MFRFKRFVVNQDRSAMKVGTDSILLGAWTEAEDAQKILDLGSGTGILSLMMAQKYPRSDIHAVEIDEDACLQAKENFEASPWSGRIKAINCSVQAYGVEDNYDLIICNPPYFEEGILAEEAKRRRARHGTKLSLEQLLFEFDRLLSPEGKVSMIFPMSRKEDLWARLTEYSFSIHRYCEVYPRKNKKIHRILLQIGRTYRAVESNSLVIQEGGPNEYTDAFAALTRDFYL